MRPEVGAYACRSKTGKLHHYYLCCKCKSEQRHRIQDVHDSIEEILAKISFSARVVNLYKKSLEKLFEKDDYLRRDEIERTRKELERLELRKSNLQNDFMDRNITSQDYHDMKEKVERDIVLIRSKLSELTEKSSPYKIYIEKEVSMLENLVEYYRKSSGATKKKILGCIYAGKLILENGRVATSTFTEPIQLILRISEVLGSFF